MKTNCCKKNDNKLKRKNRKHLDTNQVINMLS